MNRSVIVLFLQMNAALKQQITLCLCRTFYTCLNAFTYFVVEMLWVSIFGIWVETEKLSSLHNIILYTFSVVYVLWNCYQVKLYLPYVIVVRKRSSGDWKLNIVWEGHYKHLKSRKWISLKNPSLFPLFNLTRSLVGNMGRSLMLFTETSIWSLILPWQL